MAKGKAKAIEKRPVRSAAAKGKAKMPAAKEKPLHFTKMAIPVSGRRDGAWYCCAARSIALSELSMTRALSTA